MYLPALYMLYMLLPGGHCAPFAWLALQTSQVLHLSRRYPKLAHWLDFQVATQITNGGYALCGD